MGHYVVGVKEIRLVNEYDPPMKMNPNFVGAARQFSDSKAGMDVRVSEGSRHLLNRIRCLFPYLIR